MSWGLNELTKPEKEVNISTANLPTDSNEGIDIILSSVPIASEYTALEGFSCYRPPNNTAGSMVIPISNSLQPVAFVTVKVKNNSNVVLRASIGWKTTGSAGSENRIAVLFQIWRQSVETGELVCSITDSGAVGDDSYKATSFEHVDSIPSNTGLGQITYNLTAQQLNQPGMMAEISGCLTFTALCINSLEQS